MRPAPNLGSVQAALGGQRRAAARFDVVRNARLIEAEMRLAPYRCSRFGGHGRCVNVYDQRDCVRSTLYDQSEDHGVGTDWAYRASARQFGPCRAHPDDDLVRHRGNVTLSQKMSSGAAARASTRRRTRRLVIWRPARITASTDCKSLAPGARHRTSSVRAPSWDEALPRSFTETSSAFHLPPICRCRPFVGQSC